MCIKKSLSLQNVMLIKQTAKKLKKKHLKIIRCRAKFSKVINLNTSFGSKRVYFSK